MNAEELEIQLAEAAFEHQQREGQQAQAQEGNTAMGNAGLNPFAMQSVVNPDTPAVAGAHQQQQQQQNDHTTAAAPVDPATAAATTTTTTMTTTTTLATVTATSQTRRPHSGKSKSMKLQQQSGSRRPTTKKAASNKKRRSSKHSLGGGGTASTTSSVTSSSKRRGGWKRRSSSSSLLTSQYQQPYRTLKVLSDTAPSRLVNPLTEWPPSANDLFRAGPRQVSLVTPSASVSASVTTTTSSASTSNASSLTTSTSATPSMTSTTASSATTAAKATDELTTEKVASTNSPTESAASMTTTTATTTSMTPAAATSKIPNKKVPTTIPARASDFIPLLDLWHARPDTYSLRYTASLLGLDLTKLQQHQHEQNSGYIDIDTNQDIRAQIQQCLPDITSHAKDPAFAVPSEGRALEMVTNRNRGDNRDDNFDDDMIVLGHQVDPIYMQLLHEIQGMTVTNATTAAYFRPVTYQQYQKLSQMTLPSLVVLQDMAQQCGLLLQSQTPQTAITTTRFTQQHQQLLGTALPLQRRSLGFMVTAVPESKQQDNVVLLASVVYEIEWFHPTGSSSSASSSAITSKRPTLLLRLNHLSDQVGRNYLVRPDSGEDYINASIDAEVTEESETTEDICIIVQEGTNASTPPSQEYPNESAMSAVHISTATTVPPAKVVALNAGTAVPTSSQEPVPEGLFVYLIAMALEHARASGVAYAIMNAPDYMVPFLKTYFRMVTTKNDTDTSSSVTMVCDLYKCSSRYAFTLFRHRQGASTIKFSSNMAAALSGKEDTDVQSAPPEFSMKERWLARLPTQSEVAAAVPLVGTHALPNSPRGSPGMAADRSKRALHKKAEKSNFTGATGATRDISIQFRAKLVSPTAVTFHTLSNHGGEGTFLPAPSYTDGLPSLDILRTFPLDIGNEPSLTHSTESEILEELLTKQKELEELESGLQPCVESLFEKVVLERIEYEKEESVQRRERQQRILAENVKMLQQRKDQDKAFQAQLEQDMDAVCCICNDGEVTPDNQILFCESCNCAVHQVCYGVDRVPEGDYYCLACTRLGRDKRTGVAGAPLPICCELCPLKQGAFIETDTKPREGERAPFGKFIHVVCGKWQGLGFAKGRTDLIEDVTEPKIRFRQHNISCSLCQGERGCMNKCRFEGCQRWQHVTCARSSGLCEVVHGENCKGDVQEHPWTLLCPEHSKINPEKVPKDVIPVERLILAAKSFPPEPKPPPVEVIPVPFNTVGGEQRKQLLLNDAYERDLLLEITTKKLYGFRCEICDQLEEDGRNLLRCSSCTSVCCVSCLVDAEKCESTFKCAACRCIDEKKKVKEELEIPQCIACCQKGGLLREAYAIPISKKTQWRQNPKDLQRSLFGKPIWVHHLCEFWHKKLKLDWESGKVDCSQVILSNGRGLILNSIRCYLCGRTEGLKDKCDHDCCRLMKKGDGHSYFHVSCARQAGLEVNTSNNEGRSMYFYVRCYRHGGNSFNLRAKLEDLIEMEKRRSGKDFAKYGLPMKFAHAQRLLNSSIQVMRILGWAWRWAEWWVDYDSSWEPLLEPGEKESEMTKEELKIVDSTRESRCEDARKCRLAAFGVALQERKYDTENGYDRESLDRALRAILSTKSLVGPLELFEFEFLVDWLGRAYRSRSRLLGYGDDRICPSPEATFCLHIDDQTPKYLLGKRAVPGKQMLPPGAVYETGIEEVDDFLKTDVLSDEPPQRVLLRRETRSTEKQIDSVTEEATKEQSRPSSLVESTDRTSSTKKRGPGRPPRKDPEQMPKKGSPGRSSGKKRKRSLKGTQTDVPRKRGLGRPPITQRSHSMEPMDGGIPKKRGRGRPPRSADPSHSMETKDGELPKKRGPGRPPRTPDPGHSMETTDGELPKKRGPGRPPRTPEPSHSIETTQGELPQKRSPGRPPRSAEPSHSMETAEGRMPKKRGPGRPPRSAEPSYSMETAEEEIPKKRGRGRPPKSLSSSQAIAEASSRERVVGRRPGRPLSQETTKESRRVDSVAALVSSDVRKSKHLTNDEAVSASKHSPIAQAADPKRSCSPVVPATGSRRRRRHSTKKASSNVPVVEQVSVENTNESTESAGSPVRTRTAGAPIDTTEDGADSLEEVEENPKNSQSEGKGNATLNEVPISGNIEESKDDASIPGERRGHVDARYGGPSTNDELIETAELEMPARALKTDEDELPLSELAKRRRLQTTNIGTASEESQMKHSNILFSQTETVEEKESSRKQARDRGKAQASSALVRSAPF